MISNNPDIIDAKRGSNAPFTHQSQLMVGDTQIPASYFAVVKLYCDERHVLPCSVTGVYTEKSVKNCIRVELGDSRGLAIGSFWLHAAASEDEYRLLFICGEDRALRGFAVCQGALYSLLAGELAKTDKGAISISNDFTLLPYCCIPYFAGAARSITVDGRTTCADVGLYPDKYTRSSYDDNKYMLSAASKLDVERGDNGICKLVIKYVNNAGAAKSTYGPARRDIWVGGLQMILRHSPESNVRVISKDAALELDGVLDVVKDNA